MPPRLPGVACLVLAALFIVVTAVQVVAYECKASYYGSESGSITANGERFDPEGLTAAMRKRTFGRLYRVTNLANGKSVVVRHNDFGPAARLHRCVDLSRAAFEAIADLPTGVIRVSIVVME